LPPVPSIVVSPRKTTLRPAFPGDPPGPVPAARHSPTFSDLMAASDSEVEVHVPPSTVPSASPPPVAESSAAGRSLRRPRARTRARTIRSVSEEAPANTIGCKALFLGNCFLTDFIVYFLLATFAANVPLPEVPMISLGELVKSLTPTSVSSIFLFTPIAF
jgi:hypothetical protein